MAHDALARDIDRQFINYYLRKLTGISDTLRKRCQHRGFVPNPIRSFIRSSPAGACYFLPAAARMNRPAQAFVDTNRVIARRCQMMTKRMVILNLLAIGCILGGWPAFAAPKRSRTMALLDPDNDGTVDLDEAKKAASALFDKLDRDRDGTLDNRELRGRLTAAEFASADPDKDGTLSKTEYLKVVEDRFKAADPDNDGTLDEKELRSRAGQKLLMLLR
jgi:hypothetical protein